MTDESLNRFIPMTYIQWNSGIHTARTFQLHDPGCKSVHYPWQ